MTKHNIVGGRAKKAPYESAHVRIPEPLKEIVNLLADTYRQKLEDYENPNDPKLIAECLQAIAGSKDKIDEQQVIVKAVNEFIDVQHNEFGRTSSQKNKQFSTTSRGWDYFNKFKNMVHETPEKLNINS